MAKSSKLIDEESYFKETQNTILKKVFDKDFSNIKTIEDAKSYFKRLQEFELFRGDFKGDTTFKDFYEDRLKDAKLLLSKKGYDVEVLDETYSYKKREFYPFETKEEQYHKEQTFLSSEISNEIFDNDKKVSLDEINEYGFWCARKYDKHYYLLTKNGKPLSLEIGGPICGSIYSNKYGSDLSKNVIEEQGNFCVNDSNNEKVVLNEKVLTEDFDKLQSRIGELVDNKIKSKQRLQEMKSIAKKQKTSAISNIINEIKNLFSKKRELASRNSEDAENKEGNNIK